MNKLLNSLPYLLPVLAIVGVLGYSLWFRELPKAEGRVTGDYAAAGKLAAEGGIPLIVAVDKSPH